MVQCNKVYEAIKFLVEQSCVSLATGTKVTQNLVDNYSWIIMESRM